MAAFVALGLPEATLGVTWPSIRADFDQPLSAIGLLLVAITVGYLPASALSGRVAARLGPGSMLAGASMVFAAAMVLYLTGPSLPYLVVGSLLSGVAAGTIDPGINSHFALSYGTRTMNLLHASFGIGATSGPFIATIVIGAGGSWRTPYAVYAVLQLSLLAGFVVTRHLWFRPEAALEAPGPPAPSVRTGHRRAIEAMIQPHLVVGLSVATFFVYTGLEVGAGVLAFTLLTESRGLSDTAGGMWATAYWAGLTIGRVGWGVVGVRVRPERIVGASLVAALIAALLVAVDPGGSGAAGFPLLGLSLSGVFPSLVLLTPQRVGSARTPGLMGVQFSVAAIGASGIPALISRLAEHDLERVGVALVVLAVTATMLNATTARVTGRFRDG